MTYRYLVDAYKLALIRAALKGSSGSARQAARLLGVKRNVIYARLKKELQP